MVDPALGVTNITSVPPSIKRYHVLHNQHGHKFTQVEPGASFSIMKQGSVLIPSHGRAGISCSGTVQLYCIPDRYSDYISRLLFCWYSEFRRSYKKNKKKKKNSSGFSKKVFLLHKPLQAAVISEDTAEDCEKIV